MSEPKRLLIYNSVRQADACLIARWLKADTTTFWSISASPFANSSYDEIVIMPVYPFAQTWLSPLQQDQVRRFMLEDLPLRLKPGGRIYDLNELTGDLNGQTEPNSSD